MYNPESRRRAYLKARDANLAYSSEYSLKRKFNLTLDEYNEMLQKQNYVCAICENKCSRKLAVDHCHKTGRIRGLLCGKCNRGIGYLNDSVSQLEKAVNYLKGD